MVSKTTKKLFKEYIVSYDIACNKKRKYVFDLLKNIGLTPIQRSVFWGYLNAPERRYLKQKIKQLLDTEDSAFLTPCKLASDHQNNIINISFEELAIRDPDGHVIL